MGPARTGSILQLTQNLRYYRFKTLVPFKHLVDFDIFRAFRCKFTPSSFNLANVVRFEFSSNSENVVGFYSFQALNTFVSSQKRTDQINGCSATPRLQ